MVIANETRAIDKYFARVRATLKIFISSQKKYMFYFWLFMFTFCLSSPLLFFSSSTRNGFNDIPKEKEGSGNKKYIIIQ
jgi:hypothetical protein